MPAYEYLSVITLTKSDWATIKSLPEAERPAVTIKQYAYIWRPGATVPDERELDGRGSLHIYNELGRDGWRLTDRLVTHTAIDDYTFTSFDWYGHTREIGVGLSYSAIFIREVGQ